MSAVRRIVVALVLALLLLGPAGLAQAADAQPVEPNAVAEEPHERPHGLQGCAQVWGETSFVAKVVNFGLLLAVLLLVSRQPLANYLKQRRVSIEEDLAEAKRLKEQAQKTYDEYSSRLDKLDQELERIRAEMIKAGEAERDRIVAEAEHKAARMRRETEFVIEQQMKQLRADLMREAVDAAVDAAEGVLREKTTSADQQRLAEQYLAKLNEVAGRATSGNGGAARSVRETQESSTGKREEERL